MAPYGFVRVDMHCHLDFADNARELATRACAGWHRIVFGYRESRRIRTGGGAAGRTAQRTRGSGPASLVGGKGSRGDEDITRLEELICYTPFIGEVGLDFAPRHIDTRDAQVRAFNRIALACAEAHDKVISIHAVQSASVVLDVLERTGCARSNACILHWFSGTSDELQRALRMGCFVSAGARMLESKRGRAYVQAVPVDRLLLETDAPAHRAKRCPTKSSRTGCERRKAGSRQRAAELTMALRLRKPAAICLVFPASSACPRNRRGKNPH